MHVCVYSLHCTYTVRIRQWDFVYSMYVRIYIMDSLPTLLYVCGYSFISFINFVQLLPKDCMKRQSIYIVLPIMFSLVPSPTSGRHFILANNKMVAGSGAGNETTLCYVMCIR